MPASSFFERDHFTKLSLVQENCKTRGKKVGNPKILVNSFFPLWIPMHACSRSPVASSFWLRLVLLRRRLLLVHLISSCLRAAVKFKFGNEALSLGESVELFKSNVIRFTTLFPPASAGPCSHPVAFYEELVTSLLLCGWKLGEKFPPLRWYDFCRRSLSLGEMEVVMGEQGRLFYWDAARTDGFVWRNANTAKESQV